MSIASLSGNGSAETAFSPIGSPLWLCHLQHYFQSELLEDENVLISLTQQGAESHVRVRSIGQ